MLNKLALITKYLHHHTTLRLTAKKYLLVPFFPFMQRQNFHLSKEKCNQRQKPRRCLILMASLEMSCVLK